MSFSWGSACSAWALQEKCWHRDSALAGKGCSLPHAIWNNHGFSKQHQAWAWGASGMQCPFQQNTDTPGSCILELNCIPSMPCTAGCASDMSTACRRCAASSRSRELASHSCRTPSSSSTSCSLPWDLHKTPNELQRGVICWAPGKCFLLLAVTEFLLTDALMALS